ncbi:hypothetical protein WMF45_08130 [Sorangium sp. So ce448]|uniref:M1 family metallopeptidase n=1 Tax=Sorangium sp. So ce448 TaxID=3133314 RepID=UPI003F63F4E4
MDLARSLVRPGTWLVAVFLASSVAACSGADPAAPGQSPPDDTELSPEPPTEPEPPPGAPIDVQRYEVTGEFDWSRGRLVATVAVTLLPGDDGLRSLRLDSAVAEVKAVRLAGGTDLPYTVDAELRALLIDVSRVPDIAADQAITLEIDYEAAESDALRAIPARRGDPAASRAVYTLSEPLDAALWMPCHNTPEDRAVFSIDLGMGAQETMIANGTLVSDEQGASGRRMKYATDYTVPIYLMAFAIGDFEVEGTMKGSLPVSVWHRRGVPGDYDRLLDEVVRSIGLFEELLVPYPFEKYALVLVPEYGGGLWIADDGATRSPRGRPSRAGPSSRRGWSTGRAARSSTRWRSTRTSGRRSRRGHRPATSPTRSCCSCTTSSCRSRRLYRRGGTSPGSPARCARARSP